MAVPVFKRKKDAMGCGAYTRVELLEYGMMIVERVLEKRIRELVKLDEINVVLCLRKGTVDAVLIAKKLQEKFLERQLYMCLVDLEKVFDRVPRGVSESRVTKYNNNNYSFVSRGYRQPIEAFT